VVFVFSLSFMPAAPLTPIQLYTTVEQIGVSDLMYEEYELIDSIESTKLPIYIPVRKIGGQPLYSESPFRLSRS
jgi:hypothetical protein